MQIVKVSARKLRFPSLCCGCGEADPTSEFCASAQRVSGKRVVKVETRSWNFPLCSDCEHWIRLKTIALRAQRSARKRLLWSVLLTPVGLLWLAGKPSGDGPLLAAIGTTAAGLLLALGAKSAWDKAKVHRAAADGCRTGCTTLDPVVFREWRGTELTFQMSSRVFADAFRNANAAKLV